MTARPRLITPLFVLVTGATLAYMMGVGIVLPALPRFVEGPLKGGDIAVGVVIGAFSVAAILARPLVGRTGDRRGRRIIMVTGALVVAVANVSTIAVGSLVPLILVRFLQGAGEAGFFVGAATIVTDLAPPDRRAEAVSYFSVAVYTALTFGPALGETILGDGRYDAVWVTAAVVCLIAAALAWRIPDTRSPVGDGVDESAPGKPRLVHRSALRPGAAVGLNIVGFAGFTAFVPLYAPMIGLRGARVAFLVYGATVLAMRLGGARLPDRLGPIRAGTIAMVASTAGLLVMAAFQSVAGLLVGTVIFGLGISLAFPALLAYAVSTAPDRERAAVVSSFTAFFDLSQGGGAIALGTVAELTNYNGAFAAGAAASMAALVVLRWPVRHDQHEPPTVPQRFDFAPCPPVPF